MTIPAIVESYENLLHNGVYLIQIFSYTISFIIISISIITSTYIYFHKFNSQRDAYNETKLNLGRSIALALSFIVGVEILKYFNYKNIKINFILIFIKYYKILNFQNCVQWCKCYIFCAISRNHFDSFESCSSLTILQPSPTNFSLTSSNISIWSAITNSPLYLRIL